MEHGPARICQINLTTLDRLPAEATREQIVREGESLVRRQVVERSVETVATALLVDLVRCLEPRGDSLRAELGDRV